VSLNEEAEHLVAFQRAYEATSKMIGVLNSLTETLINIIAKRTPHYDKFP